MSIPFLLLPKAQVDFAYGEWTTRQVLEKMRAHRYSMIPIIDRETGKYLRSITDGDILRYLLDKRFGFEALEQTPIADIPSQRNIKPVSIIENEANLLHTIVDQNYVPVCDDKGVFIGIVTRKNVMREFLKDTPEEAK